jgi:Leu/Phe-tRNA-protein transferase
MLQRMTTHLASIGATEVSRDDDLARLARALHAPLPAAFAAAGPGVLGEGC